MAWRAAVCALALGAFSCGGEAEGLPAELLGTWRSDNPEFRDGYLELREGWVVFGADRYTINMFPIRSVESTRATASTDFAIEYLTEDGAAVPLQIVYTPGSQPRLQIGHRPETWVREAAPR